MEATRVTRVYVAGPYTANPEACTTMAIAVGDVLLKRGYAPFVPHLSHYWDEMIHNNYEAWMRLDFAWVRSADVLVRIPGESSGADREVELAQELGIPILFLSTSPARWNTDIDHLMPLGPLVPNTVASSTVAPPAIEAALEKMRSIFASKNHDYAQGSWASNFEDVARQECISPLDAVNAQIANKQSRLRALKASGHAPEHEAVEDTILDRAVYSLIALAMQLENKDSE